MTKITAAEARELAGPTVEERVDEAYESIRKAATKKQRCIYLKDHFWSHGGYSGSDEYQAAVRLLEAAGYKVRFFYEERQFVDMYTIVEW